jgi:recombination protein RecA
LTIDRITGGGFPLGRHVELYGDESAGKSYIVYKTMALSQERGNLCALIDPEHTFDPAWFTHLGGDKKSLLLEHPETAEDAVKTMMLLFQSGEVQVCGVDSVASLLPLEELEKDPSEGQDRIASQARFMSRALRRLTTVNSKTLVLWTNQFRMKIGVSFGNPTTTPGGRALRFYDTTRIEMRQGERVKENRPKAKKSNLASTPVTIGRWVQVLSEKEKTAIPYQTGSFLFDIKRGTIDIASEIIQLGLEDGTVTRTGNSFRFTDAEGNEWKGTEKQFKKLLKTNEEMRDEIVGYIADMTLALAVSEETD